MWHIDFVQPLKTGINVSSEIPRRKTVPSEGRGHAFSRHHSGGASEEKRQAPAANTAAETNMTAKRA